MTRAGLPTTTEKSGISCVTTLPGEIMEFFPIVMPAIIMEPGVITAPDLIVTGSTLRL